VGKKKEEDFGRQLPSDRDVESCAQSLQTFWKGNGYPGEQIRTKAPAKRIHFGSIVKKENRRGDRRWDRTT